MNAYKVGNYEVVPLLDGPLPSSTDKIPDPAQRAEAERLISNAGPNVLVMQVYAFLIRGNGLTILIDAGAGRLKGPALGKLSSELSAFDVKPSDVDAVLMTHLHADHFGGLIGEHGPAFENAKLILHDAEAKFWLDTPEEELPSRAKRSIDELRATIALYDGRVVRADAKDVFPDIRALPAPGHTPGHTCWLVGNGSESLLAWGDLIHISQIHLPAPYIAMEYDLEPSLALESRLRILKLAARESILIAGAHLPAPGIGKIVKKEPFYEFQPIWAH